MKPDTLVACLEHAAASPRGVRFVRRAGAQFWSYREIAERARHAAGRLLELGVEAGDRVGILAPTSIQFYDAFFGAVSAGAVPVPLAPLIRFGERREYGRRMRALLSAAAVRLVVTASKSLETDRVHPDELLKGPVASAAPSPDALALVQFSSGTTATPKPVALTHRQILANVRSIIDAYLTAYPEVGAFRHHGLSWLPLYHDMGLVGAVLTSLVHAGPLTLLSPEQVVARPARWLRAISDDRASISAGPNFVYDLCVERVRDEELEGVDLSCWRIALVGAETVVPRTLERFAERFRRYGFTAEALTPVYGLAEATVAVSFSSIRDPFRARAVDPATLAERGVDSENGLHLASCGKPLDGIEIGIVDGDGSPVPEGRVGRLRVRGPSIMSGYLGQPEATASVLRDGWLDTGDRALLLDGELYPCGRDKDCIVVRGQNFAPEAIERVLLDIDGVTSVAVVGALTERGDELHVLVETRAADRASMEDEVRTRLTESLGLVPNRISFLLPGTFPRTSSGKLRRRALAVDFDQR